MKDLRLFYIKNGTQTLGPYPVRDARDKATTIKRRRDDVFLINAETEAKFSWWPELGND